MNNNRKNNTPLWRIGNRHIVKILIIFIVLYGCTYELLEPKSSNVVRHSYFSLEYSEEHEQAKWVFYVIKAEYLQGTAQRNDSFFEDTLIVTGSSSVDDYKYSGYDRGHLCPAAVMKFNQSAMDQTFALSNISPQTPEFNRGAWRNLESLVQKWALREDSLYVVTGPIFDTILQRIGSNGVSVPGHFFKVIFDPTDDPKMIGFIMPNKKIKDPIANYAVSVDCVETVTGIDFFYALPNSIENALEAYSGGWVFE